METKYTPGEWVCWNGELDSMLPSSRGGGKQPIAKIFNMASEEGNANARLIVAAPDLYEALKKAAYMYESSGLTNNDEYKALCTAIAKAEGRE